jgi:ferredoxin-NADP reductase
MPTYEINLLRRTEIAEGTMAFYFSRPSAFDFRAGQSVTMTLIDPRDTDAKGNRRPFSIASAPSDDHIMIATRMRDTAFKRTLKNMPGGSTVQIRGPAGKFTLDPDDTHAAVMIAGGIGITPFLSMLRQATREELQRELWLFYSNRTPKDTAFLQDVIDLQKRNAHYWFIGTMTDTLDASEPWSGERGFIDTSMLTRHLGDLLGPTYYVAGPPAMVTAMHGLLMAAGVPNERVHSDEFFGY